MILSKCATCGSKKSRFIKNQEAKGLLSNLGLKTPLSKVPILGYISFWAQLCWMQFHWMQFYWVQLRWEYEMNEILLGGDKLMPENAFKTTRIHT